MILVTEGNKSYFFNGSLLESTTRQNTLTEYPTIEGTSFSDHYYREPETATFEVRSSEISKSLVYLKELDIAGGVTNRELSTNDVNELLKRWFRTAPRVTVTSLRFNFENMVLQSYSWSDGDLSLFVPKLTFKEARVQTMRTGVVNNPEQYYQAAYGDTVAVGGATAVESQVSVGSVIMETASGAAIGAMIGSIIPGLGTGVGALIGGAIGFLGSLFG